MLLLVGGSVSLAAPVVSSLASRFPVTHRSDTSHLFVVACLHLQPVWEGRGLAGAPHVVGGSKPDVDDVVRLVAVLVDHLVDGGVPVQRLVLLNVPRVSIRIPQVLVTHLRPNHNHNDTTAFLMLGDAWCTTSKVHIFIHFFLVSC